MRKTILTAILALGLLSAQAQVFEESIGTVSANTKIADHQGFSNSATLTFSGSAEVQLNGAANPHSYTTLFGENSGKANIRIADVPGSDFVISGINTKELSAPTLGFGILKGTAKFDGSDLAVEYSLDGKKWKSLRWEPLPVGEGSALVWMYRTAVLPQAEKLSIRFRQTGGGCVYRIDDVGVSASAGEADANSSFVPSQVFEETMGKVAGNTKIADHNAAGGFKNNDFLTFSGSAELQLNAAASPNDYTTPFGKASGGTNVRIADIPRTDFVISGINTKDIPAPTLGFGILKGVAPFDGSDLAVEYSWDGKKWKSLRWEPLPVGEGTALKWIYRTTSELPQAEKLSVRFRQTGGGCVYRIDDVAVFSKEK
jgi:regulation of enolase protein 1 (concanavalin A-like superfamily)